MFDMMWPPELQMCVPVSARAHACTVGCYVVWAVWRESLWCGCGCGGTVRGRGLCVVWRLDHGAWATIDVLAALYVPGKQA